MTKNKFFRIGSKAIDSQQFGQIITEELERQQEELIESAKDFYVERLEQLLADLRSASANRGLGFYAARYNNPFEDTEVTVQKTRAGYRIRVDDKKFQALDSGRPERTVTKEVRFPVYTQPTATRGVGRNTPGNTVIGTPAHIVAIDGPATTEVGRPFQQARNTNAPELDAFLSDQQKQTWVRLMPGKKIAAVKPRNFMLKIKAEVDALLFRRGEFRDAINRRILKTSIERR